jgi:hypothetical protein
VEPVDDFDLGKKERTRERKDMGGNVGAPITREKGKVREREREREREK